MTASPFPVGVTASRRGLTVAQGAEAARLLNLWRSLGAADLHHGDCVGGDAALAEMARTFGYRIVGHPPSDPRLRAHFPSDEIRATAPYLIRNAGIVAASDLILACPSWRRTGGTWWTINRARSQGVPVVVVHPDGSITDASGGDPQP